MEENFNPINLEYIETKKVPLLFKLVAFLLVLAFIFIPMYEILTQFAPTVIGWNCLPTHIQT